MVTGARLAWTPSVDARPFLAEDRPSDGFMQHLVLAQHNGVRLSWNVAPLAPRTLASYLERHLPAGSWRVSVVHGARLADLSLIGAPVHAHFPPESGMICVEGVLFSMDVSLGLPGDTLDSSRGTLDELTQFGMPVNVAPLFVLPGSHLYTHRQELGLVYGNLDAVIDGLGPLFETLLEAE